jgi:basic membrane protein A
VKKTARMALVVGVASLALTACGERGDSNDSAAEPSETTSSSSAPAESHPDFKACMVSDSGGFDDKSFNQTGHDGLLLAKEQYGVETGEIESQSDAEYADNIQAMVKEGCKSITTVGFLPPRPPRRRTPTSTSRSSTSPTRSRRRTSRA